MIGNKINDDVSLADAKFYYDSGNAKTVEDVAPEDYIKVHGITDVGEIGLTAEAKDKTNLEDTAKKYGAGMQDSPDKSIKGQVIPFQGADGAYLAEYGVQKTFLDKCRAKDTMVVKIEWADGETDEFVFKALGLMIGAPKSTEWKEFTASGKQNSEVTNTPPTVA